MERKWAWSQISYLFWPRIERVFFSFVKIWQINIFIQTLQKEIPLFSKCSFGRPSNLRPASNIACLNVIFFGDQFDVKTFSNRKRFCLHYKSFCYKFKQEKSFVYSWRLSADFVFFLIFAVFLTKNSNLPDNIVLLAVRQILELSFCSKQT